jgi:hypothetical protein
MHVHAANNEPASGALHFQRKRLVTILLRLFLILPPTEWMRGGRYWSNIVIRRNVNDNFAKAR